MPRVQTLVSVKNIKTVNGMVTVIKDHRGTKGCEVVFDGYDYGTWFWDSDEHDKRRQYMRNLKLETSNP